ncbi:hypothetical protein ACSBR1_036771 [Camellia fascicularis]
MGGFKPNLVTFILSLVVVLYNLLVAQSFGLAIGAILMDVKQATTLGSVTTFIFLIIGEGGTIFNKSLLSWSG